MEGKCKKAAFLLGEADAVFVTSGAGMGVDSDLNTFRGRNAADKGWGKREYAPYHMSKARTFDSEPHLAWGYHLSRMEAYVRATPHAGYHYLKDMLRNVPHACFTSNIDSHWERALGEDAVIVECHGSMQWMQCNENCSNQVWAPRDIDMLIDEDGKAERVPRCINPECNEYARFNVCLIGDVAFCTRRLDEERKRYAAFEKSIGKDAKVVVLEVGAGTGIPTVRRESGRLCTRFNAPLIRINMDDAALDTPVDVGHLDASNVDHVSIANTSALHVLSQIYSEWVKQKVK